MNESTQGRDQVAAAMVETVLALPQADRLPYVHSRGWATNSLARELKDQSFSLLRSDTSRALELAELGVQVASLGGETTARALSRRGLAQALHASGRYAEALPHYEGAVQGFTVAGDALEVARSMIGMVEVLMYLGRYDDALIAARTARAEFAARGDVHEPPVWM